jgi:hypothetical protein
MPIPKQLQDNPSQAKPLTHSQQIKVRLAVLKKQQEEHDTIVKQVLSDEDYKDKDAEKDEPNPSIPETNEPPNGDDEEQQPEIAASSEPTEHPPPNTQRRRWKRK